MGNSIIKAKDTESKIANLSDEELCTTKILTAKKYLQHKAQKRSGISLPIIGLPMALSVSNSNYRLGFLAVALFGLVIFAIHLKRQSDCHKKLLEIRRAELERGFIWIVNEYGIPFKQQQTDAEHF